jgi:hypothetical protein
MQNSKSRTLQEFSSGYKNMEAGSKREMGKKIREF